MENKINMKHLKNIITSIALCLLPFSISFATENKTPSNTNTNTTILVKTEISPTNRPRMSVLPYIECIYGLGYIEISCPAEVEQMEVYIGNKQSPVWTGILTAEENWAEIPYLSGEYTITCKISDNLIYQGTIAF